MREVNQVEEWPNFTALVVLFGEHTSYVVAKDKDDDKIIYQLLIVYRVNWLRDCIIRTMSGLLFFSFPNSEKVLLPGDSEVSRMAFLK